MHPIKHKQRHKMTTSEIKSDNSRSLPRDYLDLRIEIIGSDLDEVIEHLTFMRDSLFPSYTKDAQRYFMNEAIVTLLAIQDLRTKNTPI